MNVLKQITKHKWVIMIILLLLFAPATCNGVTYYRGIRGCGDSENERYDSSKNQKGTNKAFFNLITY